MPPQLPVSVKNILILITLVFIVIGIAVITLSITNIRTLSRSATEIQKVTQARVVQDFEAEKILDNPQYAKLEFHGDIGYAQQESLELLDPNMPLPPADIQVLDLTYGKTLQIFWKNPDPKPTAVRMYRSLEKGTLGERIAEVTTNEPSVWLESELENGQTYYYTLRSVLTQGTTTVESLNEEQISGTPTDTQAPAAPTDITLKSSKDGASITIRWKAPEDKDFAGVNIYRSDTQGNMGQKIVSELLQIEYTDKALKAGTEYFYIITAVDASGNESPKDTAFAVTGKANPFIP
jgi:predicted phage tail protein